jgi:hypothetical protein
VYAEDPGSDLPSKCIEVYGDDPIFRPQAARSSWSKGRLLLSKDDKVEANLQLERAMHLRRLSVPGDRRPEEDLAETD